LCWRRQIDDEKEGSMNVCCNFPTVLFYCWSTL
jgi:hypothetical protein